MSEITAIYKLRAEAIALAGRPDDLVQRAQVYLHLYRHSGGRHAFPLLAAHGALWGAGHFRRGMALARSLSLADLGRAEKLARLADMATAFKEINRRVCVETYFAYHLVRLSGPEAAVAHGVAPDLATALQRCHADRRASRAASAKDRRALFEAFFRWEQDNVVHDAVCAARTALDWPMLDRITMAPPVRFAYFPGLCWLQFWQFEAKAERIDKGLRAFALAERSGWVRVERSLARYGILPATVMEAPDIAFARFRAGFVRKGLFATEGFCHD